MTTEENLLHSFMIEYPKHQNETDAEYQWRFDNCREYYKEQLKRNAQDEAVIYWEQRVPPIIFKAINK